jgi:hypothetical protein
VFLPLLTLQHPAAAWAVMRGMMVSADYADMLGHRGFISFMQAGMIEYQNNARIFNEAIIEQVRVQRFGDRVSRMRGIYFFPSKADAEARIGDQNWPPYFVAENLIELDLHYSGNLTLVDSNWITCAPLGHGYRIRTDDLTWINRYWAGEPYNSALVWELLANGVAIIEDTVVRRRCHEYVSRVFPDSQIPILMARLASEVGTLGGLTTPFLRRKDDQQVELIYLWVDSEFHDPEVIEKIDTHPDAGLLGRLMSEQEEWKIPDFRPWGRVFRLDLHTAGVADAIIPSVHHSGQELAASISR